MTANTLIPIETANRQRSLSIANNGMPIGTSTVPSANGIDFDTEALAEGMSIYFGIPEAARTSPSLALSDKLVKLNNAGLPTQPQI